MPNYVYRVTEVVRVVDGDTVYVNIDMGMHITVYKKLRFLDLDTSELRGGTVETKTHAKAAKARLKELVDGAKNIYVRTKMDSEGKYGRLLAYLYIENENGEILNTNEVLMNEGFDKKDFVATTQL